MPDLTIDEQEDDFDAGIKGLHVDVGNTKVCHQYIQILIIKGYSCFVI